MFSCSATCIYNSSSSFGTKWFINSLASGRPTKICSNVFTRVARPKHPSYALEQ